MTATNSPCGILYPHEPHRWGRGDGTGMADCDGLGQPHDGPRQAFLAALDEIIAGRPFHAQQAAAAVYADGGWPAVRAWANEGVEGALRLAWTPDVIAAWLAVAVWAYQEAHPEVQHVTTVYTGEEVNIAANFVVRCSCGKRINVASLNRDHADNAAVRHVLDVINPDRWPQPEGEDTAEHDTLGGQRWQQVTLLVAYDPDWSDPPSEWTWHAGIDPTPIVLISYDEPVTLPVEEVRP